MTVEIDRHSGSSCPTAETLAAYLARALDVDERAEVDAHLLDCAECRQLLVDASDLERLEDDEEGRGTGAVTDTAMAAPHVRARSGTSRRVFLAGGVLATAAALALAFRLMPSRGGAPGAGRNSGASSAGGVTDATQRAMSQLARADAEFVAHALRTHEVALPLDLAGLRGRGLTLRSVASTNGPAVLDPVATRVSTRRPVFTWTPATDAGTQRPSLDHATPLSQVTPLYQVTVFDSNERVVQTSEWNAAASWTPTRDLEWGRTYTWQLGVRQGQSVVQIPALTDPLAIFEVMSDVDASRFAGLRDKVAGAPVVLAVLMVRAGLLAEADAVLSQAPDAPTAPEPALLAHLRQQRSASTTQ